MKVTCTRKDLLEGVQTAGRAVSTRTSLPILGHLLIRAQDDRLRIAATDLEIGMECVVQATVDEPGSFTVPAKTLQEILSTLPEAEVTIAVDENHTVNVKCLTSDYTILGLPPEEFPMLPEVREESGFTIDRAELRDAIKRTIFAVSPDESQVVYTGILFRSIDDELNMVATDRHRLCIQNCNTEQMNGEIYAIVPGRAMSELLRIVPEDEGTVTANVSQRQILFRVGDIVLISRLVEGQFQNYERIVTKEYTKKLIVPREQFLQSIRRASIVARENANRTVFRTIDGKLTITAESGAVGKAYEEVEVVREGEDVEMAFNWKYLLDALSVLDVEAVELLLTGPLNQGILKPQSEDDYTYVIMPMHLA